MSGSLPGNRSNYQANRRAGDWLQERLLTLHEQDATTERAVVEFIGSWAVRNVSLLVDDRSEQPRLSGGLDLRGCQGGQGWLERFPQACQGTRSERRRLIISTPNQSDALVAVERHQRSSAITLCGRMRVRSGPSLSRAPYSARSSSAWSGERPHW